FPIDIPCHLLTPKAGEMVAGAGLSMDWQPRHQFANDLTREVNREQARRTRVQFTSIEKRLEDMDLMGIDIQAITPSPAQTFYSVPADLGIETARAHKSLDWRGIEIAPTVAGSDLSEPRFRPIFQRAEELGLVLFMHPTGFPEASRFRDHYFTNIIGNPLDTTVAVHHLIFGGVLQDCPNLKLVLSHGGGHLPAYSGRIDHGASARPDCCECLRHMPTTYLKRLYFDTIVYTHHQLEYLVEQYGADHVLMGTDYP